MPPKKKGKDLAEAPLFLPKINWQADNSVLLWQLLTKMEKTENHKVLCSKKGEEV